MSDQPPKGSYWTRVASTRRHIYYVPTDQWAGIALFAVIGIGGLVATVFGAWHWWTAGLVRSDAILLLVGTGTVALALVQGRRLLASARSPEG
jgi:hypothetical protein